MPGRRTSKAGRTVLLVVVAGSIVLALTAFAGYWRDAAPVVERCVAQVGEEYTASLTLTQAENAALIAARSVRHELPPRAATIAIATAFQESDLYNIDYGDRDSLGLFQQRPSQGWGTPEQIMDPYYAADAFYAKLAKVDGYTEMEIAQAAQKVQVSAAPEAYGQHEGAARALASSLTGETGGAFSCTIDPDKAATAAPKQLVDELERTFAASETGRAAVTLSEGGAVRVDVPDADYGWSVAHWAVAHASRFGVGAVSFGEREWSARRSGDGWREELGGQPADSVLITFAP